MNASSPAPTRYDKLNRYGHEMDALNPAEPEGERHAMCTKCGAVENTDEAVTICPRATYIHKDLFDKEMRAIVTEFGQVKSGRKLARKVRQFYGRGLNEAAQEKVDELYRTFEEHIRPKPRWIPGAVWRVIQRAVLVHYV